MKKNPIHDPVQMQDFQHMDAIERMRNRPLSWANIVLVLANIFVFVLVEITGSSTDLQHMIHWGASFEPFIIVQKEYYRLFTSMFLHFGIEHLFNNMLLLFFLGDQLERILGKSRYLIIYLVGGLAGNILSVFFNYLNSESVVSAGASGAVFAVIGAMIYVVLINKGRIMDLTITRLIAMAALSLYVGFTSSGVDNVAHVGGLIFGFLLCMCCYRRKQPTQEVLS